MSKPFDRTPAQDQYRVNRRIRVPQVRVIGADGGQLGVLNTDDALRRAEEAGFDLVEVSPKAMPPVCKIMDYGKFKYENAKKNQEAKKHQSTTITKEIKFRPKTDDHDFAFKVKHIRRFLQEGNKAKLAVIFRGREIVHPETGQDVLKRVVEATSDIAQVEQAPMMEGRRMLMIIAPRVGRISPPQPRPSPAAGGQSPLPQGSTQPPVSASAPAPSSPAVPAAPAASAAAPASAPALRVAAPASSAATSAPRPGVQVKPPNK